MKLSSLFGVDIYGCIYDISPNREYMEEWVKQILKDERQKRGEPLEVKKIGQNYYLYQSTTV